MASLRLALAAHPFVEVATTVEAPWRCVVSRGVDDLLDSHIFPPPLEPPPPGIVGAAPWQQGWDAEGAGHAAAPPRRHTGDGPTDDGPTALPAPGGAHVGAAQAARTGSFAGSKPGVEAGSCGAPGPHAADAFGALDGGRLRGIATAGGRSLAAPAPLGVHSRRDAGSQSGVAAAGADPSRGALGAEAANPGSVGHPDLCGRPCLFAASGVCDNGAACEYCHESHGRRPAKADKRQRGLLSSMPTARSKLLMFPTLRQKVLELNPPERCWRAYVELCGTCGVSALLATTPTDASRSERALLKVFGAMTLRHLLVWIQRSALREEPLAYAASEALMQQLMSVVTLECDAK